MAEEEPGRTRMDWTEFDWLITGNHARLRSTEDTNKRFDREQANHYNNPSKKVGSYQQMKKST